MNRYAFELALKTGLALNCTIPPLTKWDRKQYYYPDLPKGYQISQYDLPFSSEGWLEIHDSDSQTRRIGIIRAHLEEDAGKNLHDETGRGGDSLIDLNRAGTPLLEIVSKPDLRSGAEAHAYLDELKLLLTYLEVSDCNMQEGSLRCDANVNLHVQTDDGLTVATPIVEIKNLNSFRGVESAIEYEARRQVRGMGADGTQAGRRAERNPRLERRTGRHLRPARQGRGVGLPLLSRPRPRAGNDQRGLEAANSRTILRIPGRKAAAIRDGAPAFALRCFGNRRAGTARSPITSSTWRQSAATQSRPPTG